MGGWTDTLDAQMEIFKFWRSDLGRRYGEYFVDDKVVQSPKRHGLDPDPRNKDWLLGSAPDLASVEASKMLFADPVYVSDEMFEIAKAAAETFRPEPLQESDLLTLRGFVLLPGPMVAPDINGIATTWRAFGWMPAQSPDGEHMGIHLTTYTHYGDQAEDGYILDPGLKWQPLHVTPWWFGHEVPKGFIGAAGWWVNCQSLLRLMMQHIAVREERQAPRGSRRRWQRDLPEKHEPYIVVVRLRRPKHQPTGEPSSVEWSHRWIVGGHWRAQWFPSLQTHRQIWISDYVKGPEDRPLVVRKGRAFELVR